MSLLLISFCYLPYNVILGYHLVVTEVSARCFIDLLSSFHDVIPHLMTKEYSCLFLDRSRTLLGISSLHYSLIVCSISSSLMSSVGVRYWYLMGYSCSSFHWTDLGSWLSIVQGNFRWNLTDTFALDAFDHLRYWS